MAGNQLFFEGSTDPFSDELTFGRLMESLAEQQAMSDPFSAQQAQQAIAPNAQSPAMGMAGPPTLPMGGGTPPYVPPAPVQQPRVGGMLPGQQGLQDFLGSPGAAMASAAFRNLGNSGAGHPSGGRQVDPIQAYQQAVNQQAILAQRNRAQDMQAKQADRQQELRDLQIKAAKRDLSAAPKRDIIELSDGKKYYSDTLEQVLPGIESKPSAPREKLNTYMQSLGLDPSNPASIRDPRIATYLENGGQNITVNAGGDPRSDLAGMGGFDKAAAQDNFRANLEGLPNLMNISGQFKDDYLTTMGQTRRKVLGFKDRIGGDLSEDEKQDLGDYTQFKNNVEQGFNAYRKLITGAAGSPDELAGLRESIENLEQGPTAFKASLNNRMENQARQLRGAIYLQATGKAEMGTPEMGKLLDKRSGDKFLSADVNDTVGDYVAVSLGFDPENLSGPQGSAVAKKLQDLGFLKEK